jgi:hypothetical protein
MTVKKGNDRKQQYVPEPQGESVRGSEIDEKVIEDAVREVVSRIMKKEQ